MLHLIFKYFFLLSSFCLFICSCKSKKDVIVEKDEDVDSVVHTVEQRNVIVIDSLLRNVDFSFDTLKVCIERPVIYSEEPEKVKLTAIRGNIKDNSKVQRNMLENYNREDTIAYKQASHENSEEHVTATRIYNPPNTTAICIVATGVIVLIFFIYLHFRK